ncbi:hypothetical protein ACFQU2_38405 [Siccirubricoccus deserti]
MAGRLEGKIAFISGAGSVGPGWGNGRATAVLFAREGAKVFGTDKNPSAMAETAERIQEAGGELSRLPATPPTAPRSPRPSRHAGSASAASTYW